MGVAEDPLVGILEVCPRLVILLYPDLVIDDDVAMVEIPLVYAMAIPGGERHDFTKSDKNDSGTSGVSPETQTGAGPENDSSWRR